MTKVAVTVLAEAPLHALEIWSAPAAVAGRFKAETGFSLPPMGRSGRNDTVRLIRVEPTVWFVEGDVGRLPAILGDDGAVTEIGGGIVRVCLSGPGWRRLLMESGVFDAETTEFGAGHAASTIIDHVNVRLHVVTADRCEAYLPRSFSAALIEFWEKTASTADAHQGETYGTDD